MDCVHNFGTFCNRNIEITLMLKNSKIFPGARVGILGLGITGKAAALYIQACGGKVYVSDSRSEESFLEDEKKFLTGHKVEWEAGGHTREFLADLDLILTSPGINLDSPLLDELKDIGVEIVGELAVAAGHIDAPVIAITGTNGKTTVTTLIGNICKQAGKKVFVGGNIGTPIYYYLLCPEEYDLVVLELSSFQLDRGGDFAPDIGVLLNISPDHIDWHGSMDDYVLAKMKLFVHQEPGQKAIVNGDDCLCRKHVSGLHADLFSFGLESENNCTVEDTKIALTVDNTVEEYFYKDYGDIQGVNRVNFATAILATRLIGLPESVVVKGLQSFQLLPHRLEFVTTFLGVSYYNDSKATNTGAVIGALQQFDQRVILIAGGRDKGDDYRLLRGIVSRKVDAVVVMGEAADMIAAALSDVTNINRVESMRDAVSCASKLAVQGGTVLLSPGCASFDMFSSYGHRGNEFKSEVARLQVDIEQTNGVHVS